MITLLRVDDRLLHGQVAYSWCNKLQSEAIVVPNDAVMKDPIQKMALSLAKPAGVALYINTRDLAIKYLLDPANAKKRIFVVTETIEDAHYVVNAVKEVKLVNLGGIRQGATEVKTKINKQVFLNEKDISYLNDIVHNGAEVFAQVAANDQKQSYSEVLNIFQKK